MKRLAVGAGIAAATLTILGILKKPGSVYKSVPSERNPFEGKRVKFVADDNDPITADGVRGHLEEIEAQQRKVTFYERYVKRGIDIILSFAGLVILSPIFLIISVAVWIDDPGPVLFTQKRVGKNKRFFRLHKFRSMRNDTPHDIPTHELKNPESHITNVGRVLRKTSLDELPQIWDIWIGNMSIIGPRPALWNQDLLTSERDRYNANDVRPGLTGLAQISGRDELEIPDKAQIDGEYVRKIGFLMDFKCFFGTILSVLKHDGVVEGGTGSIRPIEPVDENDVGVEDYGHLKTFDIDKSRKISVLITGAGSYIGESFKSYCSQYYPNIAVTTIDMVDGSWKSHSFCTEDGRPFDTVFHVAGIAHSEVGKASAAEQESYYRVNTDLAIETAKKCRDAGVRQFIFMSSMIVYGGKEFIDAHTIPKPSNFYGNSKWLGDKGVRALSSDGKNGEPEFAVAVLRPPMIYGKGSKGNYPTLSRMAKMLPLFPGVSNTRSMLYIENLCEFVSLLALSGNGGVYFPQNREYSNTSELVREIGIVSGRSVRISKALTPAVWISEHAPNKKIRDLAGKAFGSSYYEQGMSVYAGLDYQKISLEESIRRTEGCNDF